MMLLLLLTPPEGKNEEGKKKLKKPKPHLTPSPWARSTRVKLCCVYLLIETQIRGPGPSGPAAGRPGDVPVPVPTPAAGARRAGPCGRAGRGDEQPGREDRACRDGAGDAGVGARHGAGFRARLPDHQFHHLVTQTVRRFAS